jgi:predicted GNAT superfamily acetyltransferase
LSAAAEVDGGVDLAAVELAEQYARTSGVEIRELHGPAEMVAASKLLAGVWGLESSESHVNPGMLIALAHAGNYVAGAFDGPLMVAACIGFFHDPRDGALHSHIAGVVEGHAGHGVGKALKFHQRAWCLLRGVEIMTWTFDPLVARNAFFNLERLGARPVEYLPNFYGDMNDELNRGQASDRLLLRWELAGAAAAEGLRPVPAVAVLRRGETGPVLDLSIDSRVDTCRIEIPSDMETLRRENPHAAERWRLAVRNAFIPLLADGWRIAGFDRSGFYRLERNQTCASSTSN